MMAAENFRLGESPLVHVLALVEFNPIEEISQLKAVVAQALRPYGFLDVETATIQNFDVNLATHELAINASEALVFSHTDRTRVVNLTKNFVAYQVSSYTTFEAFAGGLLEVLNVVSSQVKGIREVRRLGLRYINLIVLEPGSKQLNTWVIPELIGRSLPGFSEERIYSTVEQRYKISNGFLAIRCSDSPGQPVLPEGINPLGLRVPKTVVNILQNSHRFLMLDLDAFCHQRGNFSVEEIQTSFTEFNDVLTDAFIATTTDKAKEKWGATTK